MTEWTYYTKLSKQGINQPGQNMQNTNEACAHSLEKEAWSCGGSQAPPSMLPAKAEMEMTTSGAEREGPVTWKGAQRQMVSWSDETFIVPDTLLSPPQCSSSPELSTVQTSAVQISAHVIFQ